MYVFSIFQRLVCCSFLILSPTNTKLATYGYGLAVIMTSGVGTRMMCSFLIIGLTELTDGIDSRSDCTICAV